MKKKITTIDIWEQERGSELSTIVGEMTAAVADFFDYDDFTWQKSDNKRKRGICNEK